MDTGDRQDTRILSIDVGSSSVRAGFYDGSGEELEGTEVKLDYEFEYTPDGKNERVYATGIRNPVGLAIHPDTGDVWTSVNERDGLGDDLPPVYVTRVREGGF